MEKFRKIIALILFVTIIADIFPADTANALIWDRQKAEHLARRTMIGVDNSVVDSLYNA
jgi:hypothetical protein